MIEKPISIVQQRFADNYIATGNATNAYLAMKPHSKHASSIACRLLKLPPVQKYIKESQAKLVQSSDDMFLYKIQCLRLIVDRALNPSIETDENGKRLYRYTPGVAINAIKELNLMQGHYAPEKHVIVNVDAPIEKIRDTLFEYDKY